MLKYGREKKNEFWLYFGIRVKGRVCIFIIIIIIIDRKPPNTKEPPAHTFIASWGRPGSRVSAWLRTGIQCRVSPIPCASCSSAAFVSWTSAPPPFSLDPTTHTNTLQEPDAHHQPHPPCWLKAPAPFSQGREHRHRLQEKPLWESWRIAKTVMLGGRGRGVVTAWSPAREARSDGWAQEKESSNTYCWAYLVHATVACSWKELQWPGDWVMCCCAPLLPQGPWFLNVSD